jgi:hypothetical protein
MEGCRRTVRGLGKGRPLDVLEALETVESARSERAAVDVDLEPVGIGACCGHSHAG